MKKYNILSLIAIVLSIIAIVGFGLFLALDGENQLWLAMALLCNSIALFLQTYVNRKKKG
ncbi:MAG: hypothetical protein ACI3W5_10875 [Faecousia sp.]